MHRFYHPSLASLIVPAAARLSAPEPTPSPALSAATIELTKEESHHVAKVLRMRAGETLTLFDGLGTTALANITDIGSRVHVRIVGIERHRAPSPRLIVASAIPKGPRADAMIEQLSQVGCDELIPLRTARSVVDPRDTKLDRFQRACIESAKQCGRAHLMTIAPLTGVESLLQRCESDVRLIALPGDHLQLADNDWREAKEVLILIGPEGGWTDQEIDAARSRGFRPWTLGPYVMRIETAAVAAAALIRGRR